MDSHISEYNYTKSRSMVIYYLIFEENIYNLNFQIVTYYPFIQA